MVRSQAPRLAAGVAAALLVLASARAATPAATAAPAALHFVPKARRLSTYSLTARFEATTRNISFDAPDAYKEGFDFWAGRMRGQKRSEVCEMTTMTQDAGENGVVPFRRTIPKYDVEMERQGQILTPGQEIEKAVAALTWEGTLDRFGNVKDLRLVAGKEDENFGDLAIPELSRLFPETDGPRDLKIGEGFKEERVVRLPTKLNIAGLENVTLKTTRAFTLKSISGDTATFDVTTTYADDPAFKPSADKTSCRISGGGSGTASFEVNRGVFQQSRQPSRMHIDLEAPLKPLPNHPETNTPTQGQSHIDLDLLLVGEQSVNRIWGEDQD